MPVQSRTRLIVMLVVGVVLSTTLSATAQSDKRKPNRSGTPVMWRAPRDIASRDLLLGPGGEHLRPDVRRLILIEEEKGGYSTKYRVKDARGRVWVAKLGKEAQSETAAVRLVWAVGYVTEINYLVPRVTIPGKGTFENVRFELRPENVDRLEDWKWSSNPFSGKRELQGLKVLMALMENWDLKDENNRVLLVRNGGHNELHYIVSDLGSTFGKTGGQRSPIAFFRHIKGSRNEPDDYVADEFVDKIEGNTVRFDYSGKNSDMMHNISIADAKWIGGWLSRLSNRQIEDAFRAANYTPEEVRLLAGAVRKRIKELMNLRRDDDVSRDSRPYNSSPLSVSTKVNYVSPDRRERIASSSWGTAATCSCNSVIAPREFTSSLCVTTDKKTG